MKEIFIVFFVMFCGLLSFSQQRDDSVIILTVDSDIQKTFDDFAEHLLRHRFTFEQKDERQKFILTNVKIGPVGSPNYRFRVYVQNKRIMVYVEFQHMPYDIYAMQTTGVIIWKQWTYEKRGLGRKIYDEFIPVLQSYGAEISFK